jgi:hypothetical protein
MHVRQDIDLRIDHFENQVVAKTLNDCPAHFTVDLLREEGIFFQQLEGFRQIAAVQVLPFSNSRRFKK